MVKRFAYGIAAAMDTAPASLGVLECNRCARISGGNMQLTIYSDVTDFLARTAEVYRRDEAANGLIYGLALTLEERPDYFGSVPFLATVEEKGELVLSALRTPPHNLLVHSVEQAQGDPHLAAALDLLAQHLDERNGDLPGVNGRKSLSHAFAAAWHTRTGAFAALNRAMRVFALTAVIWPTLPSGRLRQARVEDVPLIAQWIREFQAEALGEDADEMPLTPEANARRRIAAGAIQLWEDSGPVSIVAGSRGTPHGRTVSLVYTPPALRGRGYASAAVATYSDHLLRSGYEFCTLFTDLANPTSNHIYQAIGYRPVCDFDEYRFSD
jgi:predicted GNAT family acetyltransferase